jgi:hypothetical protein
MLNDCCAELNKCSAEKVIPLLNLITDVADLVTVVFELACGM